MSKPSAVALPDTPELPADVEQAIVKVFHAISRAYAARNVLTIADAVEAEDAAVKSLRSVIAKHLLTAEEAGMAERALIDAGYIGPEATILYKRLRLLSGSSRREE